MAAIMFAAPNQTKTESTPETAKTTTVHNSTYYLQPGKSKVMWLGTKVGGSHQGTIAIKEGQLIANHHSILSGKVIIDMESIKCTDLDDNNAAKLEGHLKSPDFFSTEKHTTASIEIKSTAPHKDAEDADINTMITGDLTIKGITHEISFPAMVVLKNGNIVGKAKVVFDRSKWNVRYGSTSFMDNLGDKAISDDIELNLVIAATIGK